MAVDVRSRRSRAHPRPQADPILERWRRWPAEAWGAIGVTALFVAITWWWLTQDHSVPLADAGYHLTNVFLILEELGAGNIHAALLQEGAYPPLTYLVGMLGIELGGLDIAPPILAENFVFVPLLALACYQLGKLAFNPLAGLLAVVFALGSPLIAEQFHVFMVDAPETAMVAVSIWLIVITEGFSRLWISALAGVAVGLAMLTKEPIPFFVTAVVLITAVRGGWRAWRGLALFAVVALVIALPWYLSKYTEVHNAGAQAYEPGGASAALGIAPARFSPANLEWYFWSMLNSQLYAPLFAFAAIGWVWMVVSMVRRRPISRLAPELAIGAFVAWLVLTETYVHDPRYSMPLLIFLAVLGGGWIVLLPRPGRIAATTALVAVVLLNTLTSTIGLETVEVLTVPGVTPYGRQEDGTITLYSSGGFLVAGPQRDGNMLKTLRELKSNGVRGIVMLPSNLFHQAAIVEGLVPLSMIAKLQLGEVPSLESLDRSVAVFDREAITGKGPPPCIVVGDTSGVWIRLGNPYARGAKDYCPSRKPQFYG